MKPISAAFVSIVTTVLTAVERAWATFLAQFAGISPWSGGYGQIVPVAGALGPPRIARLHAFMLDLVVSF
jgi:hypothetical protein